MPCSNNAAPLNLRDYNRNKKIHPLLQALSANDEAVGRIEAGISCSGKVTARLSSTKARYALSLPALFSQTIFLKLEIRSYSPQRITSTDSKIFVGSHAIAAENALKVAELPDAFHMQVQIRVLPANITHRDFSDDLHVNLPPFCNSGRHFRVRHNNIAR